MPHYQTKTWANTTAANRSNSIQINAKGQPVLSQITDLQQTSYRYDIRGRLNVITQGTGINQRTSTLVYYPAGSIKKARGQKSTGSSRTPLPATYLAG